MLFSDVSGGLMIYFMYDSHIQQQGLNIGNFGNFKFELRCREVVGTCGGSHLRSIYGSHL